MTFEDLEAQVASGLVETVIVAATDMQGRIYGKRMTARHFMAAGKDGVGTCSVVLGLGHDHSLDPGYALTGWDNGYPDLVVKPDLSTIRPYPWFDKTVFVMGDANHPDGAEIPVAPRTP